MRSLLNCIIVILLISCNRSSQKNDLSKIVYERIGDSIIFPTSLFYAESDSSLLGNYNPKNPKFKIIIYTEGDCGKCIAELYEWHNLLEKNKKMFEATKVICLIYSNNYPRFEYTTEKAGIVLPFYYDSTNYYTSINKIDDIVLYTLLLDKNNKIELIGSPLHNPAMLKLYKKVLCGKEE